MIFNTFFTLDKKNQTQNFSLSIFFISLIFIISLSYFFLKKQNTESKEKFQENFIVSISPRVYPFEFYNQKKQVDGFDVDFAKILAQKLNKNLVIKDTPILTSFKLLEMQDFDAIISTIVLSESRKKQNTKIHLMSDSYLEDDMIFLIRKEDSKKFKTIDSLKNSKISCPYGCFMFEEWFAKNLPNSEWTMIDNPKLEIHAFFEKKMDAILINRHEGLALKKKYPNQIILLDNIDLKVNYTILVNKNNHKLINEINESIKKIHQSEEFDKLKIKWGLDK